MRSKGSSSRNVTLAAGAVAAILCSAASAQDAPASTEGEAGALETITVTAQKQAENVQTVPISITAVTGDMVDKARTVNLEALTGAVPNVQIGHFSNTPTSAVFSIRGMGVIEPDPYAGQTVTVVIDGVPQVFNMISLPDLFDIERVEILRGPQGTLFGANTTGGVVNIITRQPTGEFGGRANVTVGDWNRFSANAAIDFPIIQDVLAGKVTALHYTQDGWTRNVYTGDSMGDQNIDSLRGYLKWTPSDTFDATLIAQKDIGRNGSPIVVQGGLPNELEYVPPGTQPPGAVQGQYPSPCLPGGNPCEAPGEYLSANNSTLDKDDFDIDSTTLTMNWDSPFGQWVSITGYKYFKEDNYTDQDGTVNFIDDTHRVTSGYQITQELRDTLQPTDGIRLIVGGYYSFDTYSHLQNFRQEGFFHGLRQPSTQDQDRTAYSLFAQGFFQVTDRVRLQAGVRGTREKTKMVATNDTCLNLQFDPTTGDVSGVGSSVFTGDTCNLEDYPAYSFFAPGFTAKGEETWSNVGGKLGLDFQMTPDLMLYGYVARGFKSGGFTGRITIPEDIGPYDPEYVDTIEGGLKADWLDNRLRTNLAIFYNKYKDLQLSQIYFTSDTPPRQGNTILNAANAKTYGAELEVEAAPTDRLKLNLGVAYLKAEYTDFNFVVGKDPETGDPITEDLSGEPLQNAPEWTANGGINYDIKAGPGTLGLGAQVRYTDSKFFTSLLNTPRSEVQATTYLDANVDWKPHDDSPLSFSLWARNLADKRYIASVFDAPGVLGLVNYAPPREYGLTLSYDW